MTTEQTVIQAEKLALVPEVPLVLEGLGHPEIQTKTQRLKFAIIATFDVLRSKRKTIVKEMVGTVLLVAIPLNHRQVNVYITTD